MRIDNVRLYAKGVMWGDIVHAEYSPEQGRLQFVEVIEGSGHSTVQVIVNGDVPDKEPFRAALQEKGCDSEAVNNGLFVVDIPADQDYGVIKQLLDQWEAERLVYYAEPCLSAAHYYS